MTGGRVLGGWPRLIGGIAVVGLAVTVAACGAPTLTPTPSPPVVASPREAARVPVIVDTDLDMSDVGALAIALRDPLLDVRAITITGTGLIHCEPGLRLVTYLLDELGAGSIPVACGREDAGPDALPFPDEWREGADAGWGFDIPDGTVEPDETAAQLLARAVDESPSAPTLVVLGPWTNIEDAFAADDTLPDRVAGIHAMGGVVDAPGNVLVEGHGEADGLEWNLVADPSAVAAVFGTEVPITLVPLDATDDVPVPPDLAQRLGSDRSAAGADLMYEMLSRQPLRSDPGQQLWDELAVLAVSDPDLVSWEDIDLEVVEEGATRGRLIRSDAGRPVVVATAAERAAVEEAMLESLRRGPARRTPFEGGG